MTLHIIRHGGIDLHAIIQESHAALSVDLHFGYIFDPIPMLKGVWIQEGSLHELSYALGTSSQGFLGIVIFVWGAQAPFFNTTPSLQFNCIFSLEAVTNGQLQIKYFGLL